GQAVDVRDRGYKAARDELVDDRLAQALDVEALPRGEVLEPPADLVGAIEVRAAHGDLALDLRDLGPAGRATLGKREGRAALRALFQHHANDCRDDLARLLDDDG